ncbi:AAA family ATPase [Candidatus Woesearchaeota archaeon]|nr:AAA family ATPase [Candidatus Woesearchaeota archaeon]
MNIRIKFDGGKKKKTSSPKTLKEQFMLEWYKQLGWKSNPFKIVIPKQIDDFIAGYDKDRLKINLFVIKKLNFGTILGPAGTGKTTILKWMKYELKKYKRVVHTNLVNGSNLTGEKQTIKNILWPLLNPFEKYLTKPWQIMTAATVTQQVKKRLKPDHKLVLLIDNVKDISDLAVVILRDLFLANVNFQLIVTGTKDELDDSEINQFKPQDHLRIDLSKGMPYKDLRNMIRKRIESVGGKDIAPFTEGLMKKICEEASHNPKSVLELAYNCAAEIALENWQKERIAEEKRLRELRELEEEVEEEELREQGKKLKKQKEKEAEKEEEYLNLDTYKEGKGKDSGARARRLEQEKKIQDFFDKVKKNLDQEL